MVLMNLEEKNSREIEEFLKSKGAEVVGFASLEGIKNVPKEYPNSILIGIPIEKEALKTIYTDDQSKYVESMKSFALKRNDRVLEGEDYIKENILPDYDNFVDAGVQYNDDAKHIYEIVENFHEMSVDLKNRTESIQNYIDSISNSVKESSYGINLAASNTGKLSSDIAVISDRIIKNKEVADLLSEEAEHFKN